ncbi:MAG: glycosyltransferase family 2 protein [Bacteroidota bacterium]|nr:glycosyltransferase family 2 protein [Bacteroidota bacterium]
MEKVSIITPFYNAEKYFEEAIESVISQTYPYWELLLVDDGSRDSSTEIAKKYAKNYPGKIIYLQHEGHQNKGKSTSRNLGIQKSSGEYIAFLDADDIFLPQKLEKQVRILQENKEAVMVYGPTLYWYSWTGREKDKKKDFYGKIGVPDNILVQPPKLLYLYLTENGVIPCTCGMMARAEIVKLLGGLDESIQHLYEDQVFFVKACLHGPVFLEGGSWDKYRQHPEMTSNIEAEKGSFGVHGSRKIYLEWLQKYISSLNIQDPEILKALNKNLFPYKYPKLFYLHQMVNNIPQSSQKFRKKIKRRISIMINGSAT